MIGPTIRHGPHQGAQQSSNTVPLEFRTASANESSPMMIGLPEFSGAEGNSSGVPHLPHLAILPAALAGSTRFFVLQFLQTTTTGMISSSLEFCFTGAFAFGHSPFYAHYTKSHETTLPSDTSEVPEPQVRRRFIRRVSS